MTKKLEQAARQAFETWWEREGQEFLYALNTTTDDDIKLVAEVAWKNGAYCAEQAEQEPAGTAGELFTMSALERLDVRPSTKVYLNTAPVRTKDLTDDEIEKAFWGNGDTEIEGCRAVIAKFKEKQL